MKTAATSLFSAPRTWSIRNGNYLAALSPTQQAAFQAGSFDLHSHPATTGLSSQAFFQSQNGYYDIADAGLAVDVVHNVQLATSNSLGVTVGTATETTGGDNSGTRAVVFTPDPHSVTEYVQPNWPQQVQSPGYLSVLLTASDISFSTFYGAVAGINDHNSIAATEYRAGSGPAGASTIILSPHLFSGAGDINLGNLGGNNGAAYALNNSGQAVGWSQIASGAAHAFLYSSGTIQDLNLLIPPLSGITLTSAVGIDAAGEIVAYGTDSSGQSHEYFLTPLEAPVPEPSSLAMMSLMIVALAARAAHVRSRKR